MQYHHEKWDGTGYPEGLKADAIPFLGRLLGVADFYDALTSARAYRGAMPAHEAIKLIEDGVGQALRSRRRRGRDPASSRSGELNVDAMPSEIRRVLPAARSDGVTRAPHACRCSSCWRSSGARCIPTSAPPRAARARSAA